MTLRAFAASAALGLLLTGCASFNLGSSQSSAPAAAPAPVADLPPAALDVTVEGSGAIPPGSILTLSLFDAANSAVALHTQEAAISSGSFPIAVHLTAPGHLLDGGRNLALGAVVKGPTGLPIYGTDAPAAATAGAPARVAVVSTGL